MERQYGAYRIYSTFGVDMSTAVDLKEKSAPVRKSGTIDAVLPEAMMMEILSRLPDAKDLARCAAVNRFFRSTYSQVKSVRFTCWLKNTQRAAAGEDAQGVGEKMKTPFKDTVTATLVHLKGVENLRLEIEDKMQGKRFKEDVLDKNRLWLSENSFVSKWLPHVSRTLRNLCVIDYGVQAIFKSSPLLQTLSTSCPNLRSLELRNMSLDCQNCEMMNGVKDLTLRCVKLTDAGLKVISECMPNLEVLTLVTVVGLKEAEFKSANLKVLCLGLATRVSSVKLDLSSLIKLQLKVACRETLQVEAKNLKSLALCVGQNKNLKFKNVTTLRELLIGGAEFSTLATLTAANALLEKVFLDIPCMSFESGSGAWKGLLPRSQVPLVIPDMDAIRVSCPNLHTLSLGPGLWHSFEHHSIGMRDASGAVVLPKWPTLSRLMIHMIVLNPETTLSLLSTLMKSVPSLLDLEVYVHENSKIGVQALFDSFTLLSPPQLQPKFDSWKKGLKFGCFSF